MHKPIIVFTLLVVIQISTCFFTYEGAETSRKAVCMFRQDEGPCLAGSYNDRCGKQTCYRLPGDKCDQDVKYGMCLQGLTCTCGQCLGCIEINGVKKCGDVDLCRKAVHAKKHSNLFNSEYYY